MDGDLVLVDIEIVDVFQQARRLPLDRGTAPAAALYSPGRISPFHAVTAGAGGGPKANTQGNVLVYEWGDDIKSPAPV